MASEFQRTCPQDRQTGSSIGYCIYDTLFLSLCQGFGEIFGEFNMFAKILPYFLPQLSEQHAAVFPTDGQDGNRRQYRTKSVWRLCTPSACKFSFRACFVSSRTHLSHNLCAVLPDIFCGEMECCVRFFLQQVNADICSFYLYCAAAKIFD